MNLRKVGPALLELKAQADNMPSAQLREFCSGVVQMLGMLAGLESARALMDRLAQKQPRPGEEPGSRD